MENKNIPSNSPQTYSVHEADKDALIKMLEKQHTENEKIIESQSHQITQLSAQLHRLQDEYKQVEFEDLRLFTENRLIHTRMSQLQEQVACLQDKSQQYDITIQQLANQVAILTACHQMAMAGIASGHQQIKVLYEQLSSKNNENPQSIEGIIATLKQKIDLLTQKNAALKKQLKESQQLESDHGDPTKNFLTQHSSKLASLNSRLTDSGSASASIPVEPITTTTTTTTRTTRKRKLTTYNTNGLPKSKRQKCEEKDDDKADLLLLSNLCTQSTKQPLPPRSSPTDPLETDDLEANQNMQVSPLKK